MQGAQFWQRIYAKHSDISNFILFLKMFIMTHKIDFMTYQMGPTHSMENTDTETFPSVVLVA